jgi:hypothetical protein
MSRVLLSICSVIFGTVLYCCIGLSPFVAGLLWRSGIGTAVAAFPRVPPPLVEQLALGGRLVQPIGPGGEEKVVLFEKDLRGLVHRRTIVGPISSGSTAHTRFQDKPPSASSEAGKLS